MKLGLRIFVCYLLIFTGCFYYSAHWVKDKLVIRYMEGVEDVLVDQANILAEMVGQEMEGSPSFDPARFEKAFTAAFQRALNARIYDLDKTEVDLNIYITDVNGRVIFDAQHPENIGADFSQWRDVFLTLKGEYGARSTRMEPQDSKSSVLHIAAPILVKGNLVGVLTVVKPTTNINRFMDSFLPEFLRVVLISLLAAVLTGLLASIWITLPIKRLTRYANEIGAGRKVPFPRLDSTEIGEMGRAFEKMQVRLEGKKYVEEYVQSLTHELKSPVSAIIAAAELLEDDMDSAGRMKFLRNIQNEATRINDIVGRMLELAELESIKKLSGQEWIGVRDWVNQVVEAKMFLFKRKQVTLEVSSVEDQVRVWGDKFLLHEALANLVQNALDFSSAGSKVRLECSFMGGQIKILVVDEGPGIPEYAFPRVFEKFYSLQRPDTGKKSTGLGLNFVREVMVLHSGETLLQNGINGGLKATLELPATLDTDR